MSSSINLGSPVCRGELDDAFGEFLVRENGLASREALAKDFHSQYWDERFTLNERHVPRFLAPLAVKVLVAGKYLNVVRDTKNVSIFSVIKDAERDDAAKELSSDARTEGGEDSDYEHSPAPLLSRAAPLFATEDAYDDDGSSNLSLGFDMDAQDKLALSVDRCYRLSSRALLKLLEQEHGLTAHLRSLRRYFLLEHGDFFTQFMDLAQADLAREVKDIRLVRVQVPRLPFLAHLLLFSIHDSYSMCCMMFSCFDRRSCSRPFSRPRCRARRTVRT